MRMRAIVAAVAALVLCAGPGFAGPDGSIELFNVTVNPNGTPGAVDFNATQGQVSVISGIVGIVIFDVYARLGGASASGISTVEFYLDGLQPGVDLPAGWTVTETLAPNTVPVGSLYQPSSPGGEVVNRGILIWNVESPDVPDCQKQTLTFIARYQLRNIGNPSFPNDHCVVAVQGDPPSNPLFQCPFFLQCDSPFYTKACVTGGAFIINPAGAAPCAVAVTDWSWSAVKELFR